MPSTFLSRYKLINKSITIDQKVARNLLPRNFRKIGMRREIELILKKIADVIVTKLTWWQTDMMH